MFFVTPNTTNRALLIASTLLLAWGTGCGERYKSMMIPPNPSVEATVCTAGEAQIAVRDGSLQNLCGCTESSGQFIVPGASPLTCTVTGTTTVFFHFIGIRLRHQIISTSALQFASQMVKPNSTNLPIASFAVQLATPGTYAFEDIYTPGISGQIIVQ